MRRNWIAAFCCTLLLGACAPKQPAQIGVDANYTIEVTNPMPHAMTVSLDLGANQMAVLGEVPAGGKKEFQVSNPATNDINLVAADAGKTHEVRKHVELSRGTVARVTLQD